MHPGSSDGRHKGGKVDSPAHRLPLPIREDVWYSFMLEAGSISGHRATERIRSTKNIEDLKGNVIRGLVACSTMSQPTSLPRASKHGFKN
jgi:hypothetical protein